MSKRPDDYYDDEANVYSTKRYPKRVETYVQYLFTHRRDIVLELIGDVIKHTQAPRSLFEMGCADGVLLRAIDERYRGAFDEMLGSDVSLPMIEEGRKLTSQKNIHYAMRDEVLSPGAYTCAMEIGVGALVLDTDGELDLLASKLAPGGYLICSIAGYNSIATRRGSTAADRALLKPYKEYEQHIRTRFEIVDARPCGIYVPLIWKLPMLARLLQPLGEILGTFFPELAHERVYLLKKK